MATRGRKGAWTAPDATTVPQLTEGLQRFVRKVVIEKELLYESDSMSEGVAVSKLQLGARTVATPKLRWAWNIR